MNSLPRKCLGYRTPAEVFMAHLRESAKDLGYIILKPRGAATRCRPAKNLRITASENKPNQFVTKERPLACRDVLTGEKAIEKPSGRGRISDWANGKSEIVAILPARESAIIGTVTRLI